MSDPQPTADSQTPTLNRLLSSPARPLAPYGPNSGAGIPVPASIGNGYFPGPPPPPNNVEYGYYNRNNFNNQIPPPQGPRMPSVQVASGSYDPGGGGAKAQIVQYEFPQPNDHIRSPYNRHNASHAGGTGSASLPNSSPSPKSSPAPSPQVHPRAGSAMAAPYLEQTRNGEVLTSNYSGSPAATSMPANNSNANIPTNETARVPAPAKSKKGSAASTNRPPTSHSPISPTPMSMYGNNPHHQQHPNVPLPPITAPYYNPVHGPQVSQQPVTSTPYGNPPAPQQSPYYSPYAPGVYPPAGLPAQAPPPSASSASTPPQQTGYSHSNVPTPPATYPMPPQPPLNYNGQQQYYSPSTSYYSGPFGPPAPPSGAQIPSGYPLASKVDSYGTQQPPLQRLTNGPLPGDGSQDSADSSYSNDTRPPYDHQTSIPGSSTSGSMPAPRTPQKQKDSQSSSHPSTPQTAGAGPATPASHQSSSQEENDLDSTSNFGSQAYGQRMPSNSLTGSTPVWPPPPRLPMGSEYRHAVPPPPASHFGSPYGAPAQPGYVQNQPYMCGPAPVVAPGPSSGGPVNPNQSIVDKLAGEPQHFMPQEYDARRHFFERIVLFCEQNNCPLTQQPTVSRQPVDLYVLYQQVKRRGGFEEVTLGKRWKQVCDDINFHVPNCGYQLQKFYRRWMLAYECYFDLQNRISTEDLLKRIDFAREMRKKVRSTKISENGAEEKSQKKSAQISDSIPNGSAPQIPNSGLGSAAQISDSNLNRSAPQNANNHCYRNNSSISPNRQEACVFFHEKDTPDSQQMPPEYMGQQTPAQPTGTPGSYPPPHPALGQGTSMDSHMAPQPPQTGAEMPPTAQAGQWPSRDGYGPPPPHQYPPPPHADHQQQYSLSAQGQMPVSQVPPPTVSSAAGQQQAQYPSSAAAATPPYTQTGGAFTQLRQDQSQQRPASNQPSDSRSGQPPMSESHQYASTPPAVYGQQPPNFVPPQQQQQNAYGPPPSRSEVYQSGPPPPPMQMPGSAPVDYQSQYYQPRMDGGYYGSHSSSSTAGYYGSTGGVSYGSSGGSYSYGPTAAEWAYHHQQPPGGASSASANSYGAHQPPLPPPQQGVPLGRTLPRPPLGSQGAPLQPSGPIRLQPPGPYPAGATQYQQPSPVDASIGHQQRYAAPNSVYPVAAVPQNQLHPAAAVKREMPTPVFTFPPDSVEAKQLGPEVKRRKLVAKDIGQIDHQRVLMGLKSGLLLETTWALNVLTVWLYDDHAVGSFSLAKMPGILEILLNLFRQCLREIFPETFGTKESNDFEICGDGGTDAKLSDAEAPLVPSKQLLSDSAESFTKRTRKGVEVEVEAPKGGWRLPYVSMSTRNSDERTPTFEAPIFHCHFRPDSTKLMKYFYRFRQGNKVSVKEERDDEKEKCAEEKVAPFFFRKRKYSLAEECVSYNELPVYSDVKESRQDVLDRCRCISNLIRAISFVQALEKDLAKNLLLLDMYGKLLLLKHEHVDHHRSKSRKFAPQSDETTDANLAPLHVSEPPVVELQDHQWWWETLNSLRDDALVIFCNISAHLELMQYDEAIVLPILDALIHWSTCPSAYAQDPLPVSACELSPKRICLETLVKMSVLEDNVDLMLATPPWERLELFFTQLAGFLQDELPVREFALVLLAAFASASEPAATVLAQETNLISSLISFLEFMDQRMNEVFQQRGMQALRENPELMGTSVGMLRRAANTLYCLAKVADNQPKFARFQSRLLNFTMSQLMDSRVAATISDVLYELMNSSTAAISLPKMAKLDIIANSSTKGEHAAVDSSAMLMLEPNFNATAKPVVEKHVNFVLKKNCVIDLHDDENDDTKPDPDTELLSNDKTELLSNNKTELLPNNKPSMAESATSIIMEQEVVADTFDETSSTSSQ